MAGPASTNIIGMQQQQQQQQCRSGWCTHGSIGGDAHTQYRVAIIMIIIIINRARMPPYAYDTSLFSLGHKNACTALPPPTPVICPPTTTGPRPERSSTLRNHWVWLRDFRGAASNATAADNPRRVLLYAVMEGYRYWSILYWYYWRGRGGYGCQVGG